MLPTPFSTQNFDVDAVSLNSNDHSEIVLSDGIRHHVCALALESFLQFGKDLLHGSCIAIADAAIHV